MPSSFIRGAVLSKFDNMIKGDKSKIREIDEGDKVIRFDPASHGKITGSRLAAVLGIDDYTTEFEAACNIARIYSEYETTKYTEAGNTIEPIIRSYVRDNAVQFLGKDLLSSCDGSISVDEPVSKYDCSFDHFRSERVFGGMVDGYIRVNGKRAAVLEIKTASDPDKWLDENGDATKVPENYVLQASLYAELSGLSKIVFAVGFLKDSDYDDPKSWTPNAEDCRIVVIDKKDMTEVMSTAKKWFDEHIVRGITPKWTEKDEKIVNYLTTRHVEILPSDLSGMIETYVNNAKELERQKDLKAVNEKLRPMIEESLADMMGDDTRMEYDHGGYVFTLSAEMKDGVRSGTVMQVTKRIG
jgi:hypothetical protein